MKNTFCPLCDSPVDREKRPQVFTKDIISLWKRKYHYDMYYLFEGIKNLDYIQCKKCGLKYFDPIITGDDVFYRRLEEEPWYYLHDDKQEYVFATQFIGKNDKVLDVGSGRGVFRKYIDCQFYQGLDFSSKAIELAQCDEINVSTKSVEEHCEEKSEFYDIVVLFQVIEHIRDIDSFIKSSIRCLKKGGRLIIATPDNDGFIKDATNFYLNMPPHHVLHWNEQSLLFIAEKHSLRVETVYREPVAAVHKELWYATKINKLIRKMFFIKQCFIDLRIFPRMITAGAIIIAKVAKFGNSHKQATGQSIIVVYKKD